MKFSEHNKLSINPALSFLLKASPSLPTEKGFIQRILHSQNVKYLSIKLLLEPICSFCLNEVVGTDQVEKRSLGVRSVCLGILLFMVQVKETQQTMGKVCIRICLWNGHRFKREFRALKGGNYFVVKDFMILKDHPKPKLEQNLFFLSLQLYFSSKTFLFFLFFGYTESMSVAFFPECIPDFLKLNTIFLFIAAKPSTAAS